MRIRVEEVAEQEVILKEQVAVAAWNMDSFDVKFVDDICLDARFRKNGKEIFVDTQVMTYRVITCSRCLETVKQGVKQKLSFVYNVESLGEYLEIDKDVREEILLNFPMKVLCRQECRGLCPKCGVNLNNGQCKCG